MYRRIFTTAAITIGALAAGSAAFAAANSVSTKPDPAFISHVDKSVVNKGQAERESEGQRADDTSSTTATSPPTTVDDHGVDNPATHDVADDHGVDNPATHDVADDHGVDNPATHDVADDHGVDNPATHDVRPAGHGRRPRSRHRHDRAVDELRLRSYQVVDRRRPRRPWQRRNSRLRFGTLRGLGRLDRLGLVARLSTSVPVAPHVATRSHLPSATRAGHRSAAACCVQPTARPGCGRSHRCAGRCW